MSTEAIRAALDAYAATETDAFINAEHFVDGGVWQDIEEEADRFNRQDVAPAPFAALRSVLAIHQSEQVHSYYGDTRLCCKTCHRNGQTPQWPCATVQAIETAFQVAP